MSGRPEAHLPSQVVILEGLWILMTSPQSWILHPFLVSVIPSPAHSASDPLSEAQALRSPAFCCILISPPFPRVKRLWVFLGGTPGASDGRPASAWLQRGWLVCSGQPVRVRAECPLEE